MTATRNVTRQAIGRSVIAVALLSVVSCASERNRGWPSITEVVRTHHFVLHDNEVWQFPVTDSAGRPLYQFDGRFNAGEHELPEFNFSGAFDCRLFQPDEKGHQNILQNIKEATRDWQSDGRFLGSELMALIDAPPTRRLVQHCRVRGMRITMEIYNVKAAGKGPEARPTSMDLRISFVNDASAVSDISDQQDVP